MDGYSLIELERRDSPVSQSTIDVMDEDPTRRRESVISARKRCQRRS